jgi:hypothetical protein
MLGAYTGIPNPLLPFTGQQNFGQYPGLTPFTAQQQPQISPFGIPGQGLFQGGLQNPFGGIQQQQQQNPLAALQNPLAAWQQNPLIAALQNPLLAAVLQNPTIHPLLAQAIGVHLGLQHQLPYQQQTAYGQTGFNQSPYGQTGSPYGQTGSPYGQTGSPYGQTGYPLAPQSWVGQTGQIGQMGQLNPLYQQLAARAFTPGINPWTGY